MPQSATHTQTVAIADVPRIAYTPCGRTHLKCASNALKVPSAGVFIVIVAVIVVVVVSYTI